MRMRLAALIVALMLVNGAAVAQNDNCNELIEHAESLQSESQDAQSELDCSIARKLIKEDIKGCLIFFDLNECTGSAKHWVQSWENMESKLIAGRESIGYADPSKSSISTRSFWSMHVPFSKSTSDYLDGYYLDGYLGSVAEYAKRGQF